MSMQGSDKKVTSGIELPQGPASCPSGPLESTSAATASQGDSKSAAKASPSCLKSSRLDEPLMPYKEWNIDYSELRMGVRVGIGKWCISMCKCPTTCTVCIAEPTTVLRQVHLVKCSEVTGGELKWRLN